jgi:alpha-methylacyl-CoA racemase
MLEGLTLLDFSSIGPGPRCSRLLADYGMRVVKIRPPARQTRMIEAPWYSYSANRGIPQLAIDLRQEAGRQLVRRLLTKADAMQESFRPGVAARLGIGYPDATAANDRIVYCSISGYGQRGPYASWPAHDINWLALGGLLNATSHSAEGNPAVPGGAVADSLAAHSAAVAILTALLRRASTGQGAYLDVSVIDSVLRTMRTDLDAHLAGEPASLSNATPMHDSAWYAVYQAGDGCWLAVGAVEPHFWTELCRRLGVEQLIPAQHDPARQGELRGALAAAFATRPRAHWIAELGPHACVSPVNGPAEILTDPQLTSRPLVIEVSVRGRPVRQLAPRLAVPDPAGISAQPAGPTASDEADAVLQSFGIGDAEISQLRVASVLG